VAATGCSSRGQSPPASTATSCYPRRPNCGLRPRPTLPTWRRHRSDHSPRHADLTMSLCRQRYRLDELLIGPTHGGRAGPGSGRGHVPFWAPGRVRFGSRSRHRRQAQAPPDPQWSAAACRRSPGGGVVKDVARGVQADRVRAQVAVTHGFPLRASAARPVPGQNYETRDRQLWEVSRSEPTRHAVQRRVA
jgi:hypothetical protein